MDESCTIKKIFNAQPIDTRRKSRPNLGWIDGVEKDLIVLRIEEGRKLAWRRPRPILGCRATEERRKEYFIIVE
ncbi:hypothetical protein TNCV_2545901 [Trichonephila clavipes]|nr:hypothetical protein TNCV_2545901 [Trichonephila clavipes]